MTESGQRKKIDVSRARLCEPVEKGKDRGRKRGEPFLQRPSTQNLCGRSSNLPEPDQRMPRHQTTSTPPSTSTEQKDNDLPPDRPSATPHPQNTPLSTTDSTPGWRSRACDSTLRRRAFGTRGASALVHSSGYQSLRPPLEGSGGEERGKKERHVLRSD
jgi:hypothetical protein